MGMSGKRFFFEKKKQKTFDRLTPPSGERSAQRMKVFLLLFLQKKKCFLTYFDFLKIPYQFAGASERTTCTLPPAFEIQTMCPAR